MSAAEWAGAGWPALEERGGRFPRVVAPAREALSPLCANPLLHLALLDGDPMGDPVQRVGVRRDAHCLGMDQSVQCCSSELCVALGLQSGGTWSSLA
eukprot:7994221-Pyramimonas_sp.AAC.1